MMMKQNKTTLLTNADLPTPPLPSTTTLNSRIVQTEINVLSKLEYQFINNILIGLSFLIRKSANKDD